MMDASKDFVDVRVGLCFDLFYYVYNYFCEST